MYYFSNVHTIWITADEAAICHTTWYVCLVSNKEPKNVSCSLWKILSFSDLRMDVAGICEASSTKQWGILFRTSSPSIWYAWIFHVFFCFQLVQIIPMARTVGKHVDNVHRMLHVTREVVYVQMAVRAAIGPHCARSVSTLCMLTKIWKIDICNFRMHSIPSSIFWFSRYVRRQINGNPVNMHIPNEGIFLRFKLSYFINIIL